MAITDIFKATKDIVGGEDKTKEVSSATSTSSSEQPQTESSTPSPTTGQEPTVQTVEPSSLEHQGTEGKPLNATTEEPAPNLQQSSAPGQKLAQQVVSQNPELVSSLQGIVDRHERKKNAPDWSTGFMNVIQNGYEGSIMQGVSDYNRWATDNDQPPLDAFEVFPLLQQYDTTKSYQENVDDEKKLKRQERWEQIGSVLSHVGNLVGTILGAPSQKLTTGAELTDRQHKLRDYTMKQRREAANDMMALYYKDRADQRANELQSINIDYKNQQMELARQKADREAELARLQQERVKAQTANDEARVKQLEKDIEKKEAEIKRMEELLPYEVAQRKASANASNASASASYARANATRQANEDWIDEAEEWGQLYPTEYEEWKKANQIETGRRGTKGLNKKNPESFVKRMRKKYGSVKKVKQGNNTPPSRRKNSNNQNVPPSRRK